MSFFHRSRGHLPNAQSVREDRQVDANRQEAERIEADYEVGIAYWSVDHGCVAYDYTGEQFDRLHALKAAGGDARIAKCLMYGQWIFDLGLINEWGAELP